MTAILNVYILINVINEDKTHGMITTNLEGQVVIEISKGIRNRFLLASYLSLALISSDL